MPDPARRNLGRWVGKSAGNRGKDMAEHPTKPLLFKYWPGLEGKIPWTGLAPLETPVQRLKRVEKVLGVDGLWVKRDDLTSPLYGGNKARKLEFILAHACNKGYRKVIGVGGIGSNHCVANAVFCRQLGLKPLAALVNQPLTRKVRDNLLLGLHFGNEILYARGAAGLVPKVLWKYLQDRSTYLMMPGGSMPLGILGYVNAALELKEQVERGEMPEPDHIFVACGSAGTAAGLALGLGLMGLKARIHAVQVAFPVFSGELALQRVLRGAWRLMTKYEKGLPGVGLDHLIVDPDYYGGLYGKPTREGIKAAELMDEAAGIELETTYTGKAFAALMGFAKSRRQDLKGKTLLYWHTYNGRDFSDVLAGLDYRDLPKELHWVFEAPLAQT